MPCCNETSFTLALPAASGLWSWSARRRPSRLRFATFLGGDAGRSLTSGFGSVRLGPPPIRRRRDEARRCPVSFSTGYADGLAASCPATLAKRWVRPPSDSAKSGEGGLRFAISCLCGEVRADQPTQAREAKRRLP